MARRYHSIKQVIDNGASADVHQRLARQALGREADRCECADLHAKYSIVWRKASTFGSASATLP